MVSTRSLDLRSVTSILVELKTLSTSALIVGIDSIVEAKLANQGHSSALLIHQFKICWFLLEGLLSQVRLIFVGLVILPHARRTP